MTESPIDWFWVEAGAELSNSTVLGFIYSNYHDRNQFEIFTRSGEIVSLNWREFVDLMSVFFDEIKIGFAPRSRVMTLKRMLNFVLYRMDATPCNPWRERIEEAIERLDTILTKDVVIT